MHHWLNIYCFFWFSVKRCFLQTLNKWHSVSNKELFSGLVLRCWMWKGSLNVTRLKDPRQQVNAPRAGHTHPNRSKQHRGFVPFPGSPQAVATQGRTPPQAGRGESSDKAKSLLDKLPVQLWTSPRPFVHRHRNTDFVPVKRVSENGKRNRDKRWRKEKSSSKPGFSPSLQWNLRARLQQLAGKQRRLRLNYILGWSCMHS